MKFGYLAFPAFFSCVAAGRGAGVQTLELRGLRAQGEPTELRFTLTSVGESIRYNYKNVVALSIAKGWLRATPGEDVFATLWYDKNQGHPPRLAVERVDFVGSRTEPNDTLTITFGVGGYWRKSLDKRQILPGTDLRIDVQGLSIVETATLGPLVFTITAGTTALSVTGDITSTNSVRANTSVVKCVVDSTAEVDAQRCVCGWDAAGWDKYSCKKGEKCAANYFTRFLDDCLRTFFP